MTSKNHIARISLIGIIMLAVFSGLGARLVYLHLGPNESVRSKINNTRHYEQHIAGTRGRILDRNDEILALDLTLKHVAVDPSYLYDNTDKAIWPKKIKALAARLAYLLDEDKDEIELTLKNTKKKFKYLKKYVRPEKADQIAALKERCIVINNVKARNYPKGNLMAHVVGYTNLEGVGSAGVEMTRNLYLDGRAGLRVGKKDGRRREMYSERSIDIAPANGMNIHLTVDQYLQNMVEEALLEAMEEYNAKGAWAIIQECKTGKVLAMANKPDFDLNEFRHAAPEFMRNRSVAYTYEPGSTVKPLVIAAALNEGLITTNDVFDCESGSWQHRGRPLRDFHAYGNLSVPDVLKKSSNIGTAKIGLLLGKDRLHSYFRSYGFGQKTGIELPGEEYGIFYNPDRWSGLSLSRISIGHEISVTGLQILNAINSIANDGFVMRPRVIEKITDDEGRAVYQSENEVLARPVSADAARKVRAMMARICQKGGTGHRAAMETHQVAGKTGTAEKSVNGYYSKSANVASFVGFLPAENPVLSMVVVVDEPQPLHTGGRVAAPVFKEIAKQAVRYLNIPGNRDIENIVMR